MARILIVLIAFSAMFPTSGFASVCAPLLSQASSESSTSITVESHTTNNTTTNNTTTNNNTNNAINNVTNRVPGSFQNVTLTHVNDNNNQPLDSFMSLQTHCNDPSMPCNMNMSSMDAMDCDSGCCVNCVGVSFAALTSLAYSSFAHLLPIKPASGNTNFYTRIISPELRPPLV